jgi:hypothetical protein
VTMRALVRAGLVEDRRHRQAGDGVEQWRLFYPGRRGSAVL